MSESVNLIRTTGYAYDSSGRLSREHSPDENIVYSYDSRGNITSVVGSAGENWTYSYLGDRVSFLARSGQETVSFAHDSSGRMTYDGLEGVSIEYNFIDLPQKVIRNGVSLANYFYLSKGGKTCVMKPDGQGIVYRGPFTYRRSASGALTFESVLCAEGRLTDGNAMLYVTDHLGSVVAMVRASDGALFKATNYGAYGNESSLTSNTAELPSGVSIRDNYTGKEWQNPDFGVSFIDFGARHYSSNLCRWLAPDPFSEKYYGLSPYTYCAGNPVNAVDVDGRIWDTVIDIGCILYDVGSAVYHHVKGNKEASFEQLKAAGTDLVFALIPGVSSVSVKGMKNLCKGIDIIKLQEELSRFKVASEFCVDSYKALKKKVVERYGKHSGYEVHHLIEKRFIDADDIFKGEILSIVLTKKEEHKFITKQWREIIGYNKKIGNDVTTESAKREDVMAAAKIIYIESPELLKMIEQMMDIMKIQE